MTETEQTEAVAVIGLIDGTTPPGTTYLMRDGGVYTLRSNTAKVVEMAGAGDAPGWAGPRQQWNETQAGAVVEVEAPEPEPPADPDAPPLAEVVGKKIAEANAAIAKAIDESGPPQHAVEPAADGGDGYGSIVRRARLIDDEISEVEREIAELQEELKAKKGYRDEKVSQLRAVIRDRQLALPLEIDGEEEAATDENASQNVTAAGADKWMPVRLDSLTGLTPGILHALAKAEIVTLGDLTVFQERQGDVWAQKIKGLGPASVEKLTTALEAFWVERKAATDA